MYRLQGYEVDGRRISIVIAKDRRKTPDEMKPRGDRGGRDRRSRSNDKREDGGRGRGEERDVRTHLDYFSENY